MKEPIWLDRAIVEQIHDRYLGEFGGFPGVRDAGVLESSTMRARWRYTMQGASLAECAAAYGFAFATAHAFHDGNKRTAYFVAVAFLEANRCAVTVPPDEEARDVMISVATKRMSEEDLACWFQARIRPRK